MENVIEAIGLTKSFGAFTAVDAISFHVKKGEIFGLSGLVGSRRTELLEAIFGARKRESGELILNGKQIENSIKRFTRECLSHIVHKKMQVFLLKFLGK